MYRHLWLIGMMGVGKTTIGRLVAERTACGFLDTDDEVVAAAGTPIPDLWAAGGETRFRELEEAAIAAAALLDTPTVIATGGGAVLRASNVTTMKGSGTVVWLTAPPAELAGRTTATEGRRPLLDGDGAPVGAVLAALLEQRRHRYEVAADHIVVTEGRSIDAVVAELESLWRPG